MPKLIKNNQLVDDTWAIVSSEDYSSQCLANKVLLTYDQYLSAKGEDNFDKDKAGIVVASDFDIHSLVDDLNDIPVIALNFAAFADGRSFSQARILRDQYDYSGEIRALGAYIQDQMTYLKRCGFDAFAIADDADTESLIASLSDFSDAYQAACDDPRPLFRRRV